MVELVSNQFQNLTYAEFGFSRIQHILG